MRSNIKKTKTKEKTQKKNKSTEENVLDIDDISFTSEYDTLVYLNNEDRFSNLSCFQWIMHKYNNYWMTEHIQRRHF